MRTWLDSRQHLVWWQGVIAVLAGGFLFNLGQGVLRPTLPLYLQEVFAANYQMVTAIPVVFGLGKWIASLPTGYLMDHVGRRSLMACGLLLIAMCDVASAWSSTYGVFLSWRALAGVGWAMFATVATTAMIDLPAVQRRGRAVSLLMICETLGLLLGSGIGGVLYQAAGVASPLFFEAACLLVAAIAAAWWPSSTAGSRSMAPQASRDWRRLGTVLRTPGVVLMGLTNAVLMAVHVGVLVFLYPLYLVERAGVGPETVGIFISLSVLGTPDALARWQCLGPGRPPTRPTPRLARLCRPPRKSCVFHPSDLARAMELGDWGPPASWPPFRPLCWVIKFPQNNTAWRLGGFAP